MITFKEFYLTEVGRSPGTPRDELSDRSRTRYKPALKIPDTTRLEIGEYIEEFPEVTYKEIAAAFGVSEETVARVGNEFEIARKTGSNMQLHKGTEAHRGRVLSDEQEKKVLKHYMDNFSEMTLGMIGPWANSPEGIKVLGPHKPLTTSAATWSERIRAMAKRQGVRLPPADTNKYRTIRRGDPWKTRHAVNPTGTPTVKPDYYNPGTTTNPPFPPAK